MPLKRFIQTPPQAPTRNYDVANKKYVDEHVPYVSGGGSGTTGQMVKWTGSATMGDATNTDAEVSDAVDKKHVAATAGSGIGVTGQEIRVNISIGTLADRPTGETGNMYFVDGDGTSGNNQILWIKSASGWVAVAGVFK
jgi:hypothetical protein